MSPSTFVDTVVEVEEGVTEGVPTRLKLAAMLDSADESEERKEEFEAAEAAEAEAAD